MGKVYEFSELKDAPLEVDAIYKGGTKPDSSSEPMTKLLPKCGISGGFRKVMRNDKSGLPAYVVLYTSMTELEWPDYLDRETGVFRFYGDNKTPGKGILDTKPKGNKLLEDVFAMLNGNSENWKDIPPFLVFCKSGNGWDRQFLGLAVPGNPRISPDRDLISFWRTFQGNRFQNYESYFTILDTGKQNVRKEWLEALINNHDASIEFAPDAWQYFVLNGRQGIKPLISKKIVEIPKKYIQLQSDEEGRRNLETIRKYYSDFPAGFEACAVNIVEKMDNNFVNFSLTRPWRDGGRDAIGYYEIACESKANNSLRMECALEAKCYAPENSVGVKQMSRLISRIKYRQFGILVTTSYVDSQAYKEVYEDGHPILIVTASDISWILRKAGINNNNVKDWLDDLDYNRI